MIRVARTLAVVVGVPSPQARAPTSTDDNRQGTDSTFFLEAEMEKNRNTSEEGEQADEMNLVPIETKAVI